MNSNTHPQVKDAEAKFKVLIVGGGSIAGGFDRDQFFHGFPYSHAGGYIRDGRFEIVGCVEPDEKRCAKFLNAWKIPNGFSDIGSAIKANIAIDLVSICSPSTCHAKNILEVLSLNPKLIFCEKPLTLSSSLSLSLIERCRDDRVKLAVNYSRRFDPFIWQLKDDIALNKWGDLRSVSGIYNKGLFNNGSHMLDLLLFLFGSLKVINSGSLIFDHFPEDPSIPVWLESNLGKPIQINCSDSRDYSIFEMKFIFEKSVLEMHQGGLEWLVREPEESSVFHGYKTLSQGIRSRGGYEKCMLNAISNIHDAITNDTPLLCNGEDAYRAQILCEEIINL